MGQADRGGRLFDWLWLAAFGVASSVWCVSSAGRLSATFDEPVYVSCGLERWRTGSHAGLMKLGTMPLPVDVQTLPLYLAERWRGEPFDAEADLDRLLPWARAMTLGFWWLLLIYGRLAGREIGGPWGGRLAVALLACEPSLLAHAGLATTDISLTACVVAFAYHFRTGRGGGWLRRVGLPAFWFGAAVLAKATGLAYAPLCMVAIELERMVRERDGGWSLRSVLALPLELWRRPFCSDCLQIGALGLVLVFVFCGSDWQPQRSWVAWAHTLPEGPFASAMTWLAEHCRVFSNAGDGLMRQFRHNVRGHGAYLLGQTDPRSLWYYFPVLLTIKLSLPLLLAPLAPALLRPRALLNWAILCAAALLAFSLMIRVQIGIRLVLPLVALLAVGLSGAVVRAIEAQAPGWRRRLVTGGAAAGIVWAACAALFVWPEGLCYVNELWGGTARGYRLVSETNYDWGQGLKELTRWHQAHAEAPLDVWYFGTDPTVRALPLRVLPLHSLPVAGPEDLDHLAAGHYLAVSTTMLYGSYAESESAREAARLLRGRQPIARTATFLIYDFTRETCPSRARSAAE